MSQKRNWTKEEIEYLLDSWGQISIPTIAKNLNRSKYAILNKARRLKLGPFLETGEYITLNKLHLVIKGHSGGTYTKKQWIEKGLPVKKQKVGNYSFLIVYLDDFWTWAEKNRTIIDFSKMEKNALGKEPKWLEEQRKADLEKKYFKNTPWTAAEDNLLKSLLKTYKYTYRQLSLRLQRTEGAIKRRILDLGIKQWPLRMPNHNPWKIEEMKMLIDLYYKGHTHNTMVNYINRSAQAIRGKIERLIKDGVICPRSEFRKTC